MVARNDRKMEKRSGAKGAAWEIQSRVIPAPSSIPARIKPITPTRIQRSDFENSMLPGVRGASFAVSADASVCKKRDVVDLSETSGKTSKQYPLRGMVSM